MSRYCSSEKCFFSSCLYHNIYTDFFPNLEWSILNVLHLPGVRNVSLPPQMEMKSTPWGILPYEYFTAVKLLNEFEGFSNDAPSSSTAGITRFSDVYMLRPECVTVRRLQHFIRPALRLRLRWKWSLTRSREGGTNIRNYVYRGKHFRLNYMKSLRTLLSNFRPNFECEQGGRKQPLPLEPKNVRNSVLLWILWPSILLHCSMYIHNSTKAGVYCSTAW